MKIWVVYFRGEPEYATRDFYDAANRAYQLSSYYDGAEVKIEEESYESA